MSILKFRNNDKIGVFLQILINNLQNRFMKGNDSNKGDLNLQKLKKKMHMIELIVVTTLVVLTFLLLFIFLS
jgi:hypothetical protein